MIEAGKKLPRSTLALPIALSSGTTTTLSELLVEDGGRWLVLYFYPKDSTPGCTTEGNDFNALLPKFRKLGATVVGVSRDSLKSHCNFRDRQGAVQGLRRHQAQEALRPRIHRHRAQHLPDRPRRHSPRRVAQGQGPRPRRSRPGNPQARAMNLTRIKAKKADKAGQI